jgi:hypothetical protein
VAKAQRGQDDKVLLVKIYRPEIDDMQTRLSKAQRVQWRNALGRAFVTNLSWNAIVAFWI